MGTATSENAVNMIAHNPLPFWEKGGSSELTGTADKYNASKSGEGARKMLLFCGKKDSGTRQIKKMEHQMIAQAGSFKGMYWVPFGSLPPRRYAAASARAKILE